MLWAYKVTLELFSFMSFKQNYIKKIKSILLYSLVFYLLTPRLVSAQSEAMTVSLSNPLSAENVPQLVGNIISVVLSVIGSLALLAFIVGGVRWLFSGGNSEQVKKGAKTMLYAVIGLFVVFGSYAILSTVITALTG